jgi:hypothetical protein
MTIDPIHQFEIHNLFTIGHIGGYTIYFTKRPSKHNHTQAHTPAHSGGCSSLGVGLMAVYAHTPDDHEAAVDAAVVGGAGGMVVPGDPIFVGTRLLPPVAMRHRLPAIFVDGVSVKAGRRSRLLTDHCKAAADVALDLERKAARGGPFPIEVPAKYADEYDASSARASSITPAPRPAILICRSPLATPISSHSSYCIGGFWPVHGGHNGRAFFGVRRRAGVFLNWAAIFGQGAGMDFYGLE